jgi:hypothetical protein
MSCAGRRLGILIITTTDHSSCGVNGPTGASSDLTNAAQELAFCASEVNRYRAIGGLSALSVSPGLEAYASQSAQIDGMARRPHQHFTQTNGGGVALAENELLSWTGDIHAVVRTGLGVMWNEGPNGEHHRIMAGPYAEVGCGVFIDEGGVTVAQDFR